MSLAGLAAEETSALLRDTLGIAQAKAQRVIVFDADRNHELVVLGMGGGVLGISDQHELTLTTQPADDTVSVTKPVRLLQSLPEFLDVNLVDWFLLFGTETFEKMSHDLKSFLIDLSPGAGTTALFDHIEEVDKHLSLAIMLSELIRKWMDQGVNVAMAGKANFGPLGRISVEIGTKDVFQW
ncbi:hypothetical protein [Herbaspirillum sp. RV1423]|uniref:hypothetical protein n=1 Tax=Herbaspirillum sp. RV1423 TaxID=1443993 RepID=UPI0012DCBAEA|nr:hypothetical protein [Herbaspirillum sp. RV1423]